MALRFTLLSVVALSTFACAPAAPLPEGPRVTASAVSSAPAPAPALTGLHFDIAAVDAHADACTDFYDYACGGWRATHPIPGDQARWSRYSELVAVNAEHERTLVEDAAKSGAAASPAEQRVGAYYAACMDEAGIDARGLAPIHDLLASIDAIKTKADAQAVLADLHVHAIEALFATYAETDPEDSTKMVVRLDKGSLGLPDPGDYTNKDDASVARRASYLAHLNRLFRLVGANEAAAKKSAERVLAFETSLAAHALSAADRRNHDLQNHPMKLAELKRKYPAIDWPTYFAKLGVPATDHVNVAQPAWLAAVHEALTRKDLAALRDYLRMISVRAAAMVLPRAIEEEVFDFRQKTLRGIREMAPRWKRCLRAVDGDIGDDVGRIFLARYFTDETRTRAHTMVDALVAAYRARLASSDWLGGPARDAALAKLDKSLIVLGASNRPRSFDGLRIDRADPYGVW